MDVCGEYSGKLRKVRKEMKLAKKKSSKKKFEKKLDVQRQTTSNVHLAKWKHELNMREWYSPLVTEFISSNPNIIQSTHIQLNNFSKYEGNKDIMQRQSNQNIEVI